MYEHESAERRPGGPRPVLDGRVPDPAAAARREQRRAVRADVGRVGRVGVGRVATRPRRAPGPRPARPAAVAMSVRPAQGERPLARDEALPRGCPTQQRILVRRSTTVPLSTAGPVRRLLGGVVVAVLAAAVVIGWGQLLALTAPAEPAPAAPGPAAVSPSADLVVVGAEQTVWELARRIEPAADEVRLAALTERIAVSNALTSVELRPGQVLRVPVD